MAPCAAPAWLACERCDRILCWEHQSVCYCVTKAVGIGGVAVREEEARAREIVREREEEIERTSESLFYYFYYYC